jgi:peptidoglycan hydrolase-like protein with peptidoglycan-binding domain
VRNSRDKRNVLAADESESRSGLALRAFDWSHRDAVAAVVAASALGAIVINALFMQIGPHPAPMFKSAGAPTVAVTSAAGTTAAVAARARLPEPGSGKPEPARSTPRPVAEIIADMQRELARRGFFDGVVDGRRGPRTEAAIHDFEVATGMPLNLEPTEDLLAAMRRSTLKAPKRTPTAGTASATAPRPPVGVRNDPIAEVLAPSKRVLALQRALAEHGYGQIKPTGVMDAATRAAIEKFERDRKLPVTGEASDRVVRELTEAIGRPLD